MANESDAPFSVRVGARLANRDLQEGVPDWLIDPLLDWLQQHLDRWSVKTVALRARISILGVDNPAEAVRRVRCALEERALESEAGRWDLLDAIDRVCQADPDLGVPTEIIGGRPVAGSAPLSQLNWLLVSGGSAYRIRRGRLEQRVDETTVAAFERAIATIADEASMHLRRAWAATYGRDPEPTRAYGEAVRAVEAVACPLLLPNDQRPTLGKAIAHLRDQPEEWKLVLPGEGEAAGVGPLMAMLRLLWTAQRSRHAGGPNVRDQFQAEAEAALSLAITLVQWFTSGFVHRVGQTKSGN